jgi:hypothetical protein
MYNYRAGKNILSKEQAVVLINLLSEEQKYAIFPGPGNPDIAKGKPDVMNGLYQYGLCSKPYLLNDYMHAHLNLIGFQIKDILVQEFLKSIKNTKALEIINEIFKLEESFSIFPGKIHKDLGQCFFGNIKAFNIIKGFYLLEAGTEIYEETRFNKYIYAQFSPLGRLVKKGLSAMHWEKEKKYRYEIR